MQFSDPIVNESPTLRMFTYKDKDKKILHTKPKKNTSLKKMKQYVDDKEKNKNLITQMCVLMSLLFKQFEITMNLVRMLENQTGSIVNSTCKDLSSLTRIVVENLNRK